MSARVSYTQVSTWRQCPRRWRLKYQLGLEEPEIPAKPGAFDALAMGRAVHTGIEGADVAEAVGMYEREAGKDEKAAIQIRHAVLAALELPVFAGCHHIEFERKIESDVYIGYADVIADGAHVYDIKTTNNAGYLDGTQLLLYASELAREGMDIQYCSYIVLNKLNPRKRETAAQYEERFADYRAQLIPVRMDDRQVAAFWRDAYAMSVAAEWPKCLGKLCDWCGYKGEHCDGGE